MKKKKEDFFIPILENPRINKKYKEISNKVIRQQEKIIKLNKYINNTRPKYQTFVSSTLNSE